MNTIELARLFSIGKFEPVYDFIAPDAVWTIIGEKQLSGKDAIMAHCQQVSDYFRTVTTNFITDMVIAQDERVVVSGTAEFSRAGQRLSFISACDVYEFTSEGQLKSITSYCIPEK